MPSAIAIRGVEARFDDPNWHRLAVYGLGTYARLLREAGDAQESKRLVAVLVARFRAATTNADKVDLLFGLSNSGARDVLDLVRGGLTTHPSEDLRVAAIGALRLVDGEEADGMLAAALSNDQEKHVRLEALRALKHRDPSEPLLRALIQTALHDKSEKVRYRAVRIVAALMSKKPNLRTTLEQVSKSDSEPIVRAFAASVLNGETPVALADEEQSE